MNYNKIDPHGRTVYGDSVLHRLITFFPPAKWGITKEGTEDWIFSATPVMDTRIGAAGAFNLGKVLLTPPAELLQLQDAIRAGKMEKPQMYGMTPAAFVAPRRKASNVQYFTGLMPFDIDAKDNAGHLLNYEDLKAEISKLPFTAYCGRSISGRGFWGLFHIGYHTDTKDYEAAFKALQEGFVDMGIIIDPAPANPASLRFYSFDPDAYVNHYPQVYERRYIAPQVQQARQKTYTPTTTRAGEASQSIFDQFNQASDICTMLEHYGWKNAGRDGEGVRYIRPGKQSGKSAWALPAKNIAYIWTSSTPLNPNEVYNPAKLYAMMEHSGDWKAAAKALRAQM